MDTNINNEASEAAKQMEGQVQADPNKPSLLEQMNNLDFDDNGLVSIKDTPKTYGAADALGGSAEEESKDPSYSDDIEDKPKAKEEEVEPEELEPSLEIEEEFFTEEEKAEAEAKKEEAKEGEFDEAKFDAETAAVLKALEEKGHPGDIYKKVREELKQAKQSTISPEIQKEIEDLKLKAQEAEGLRARIDELSNQSAKLKVENSDEYIKEVVRPAENIFAKAEELAAQYDGDADVIKNIIRQRDRRVQNELISEQLKDMSDFDRSEVYRMVQDFNKLVDKREEMLEHAEKNIELFEAKRLEEESRLREEQKKNVQTIQKEIWSKYEDKIPGLLDEKGKPTEEFKSLMAKSMSIDFSKAKSRDQAYASFAGVLLPYLVKQMNSKDAELAKYRASDSNYVKKSASPSKSVAPVVKASKDEPKGLLARMAEVDLV